MREKDLHATDGDVPWGTIAEVWAQEGYGYVETDDGRAYYFDRWDVRPGQFHLLFVGTEVVFRREPGPDGWRVRDLRVVRQKAHLLP